MSEDHCLLGCCYSLWPSCTSKCVLAICLSFGHYSFLYHIFIEHIPGTHQYLRQICGVTFHQERQTLHIELHVFCMFRDERAGCMEYRQGWEGCAHVPMPKDAGTQCGPWICFQYFKRNPQNESLHPIHCFIVAGKERVLVQRTL